MSPSHRPTRAITYIFLCFSIAATVVEAFQAHHHDHRRLLVAGRVQSPAAICSSLTTTNNHQLLICDRHRNRPSIVLFDGASASPGSEEQGDGIEGGAGSDDETEADSKEADTVSIEVVSAEVVPFDDDEAKQVGLVQRIKNYFGGNKDDEKLTFRQKMSKMGLAVALSYGWVSNMSYCVSVSIAWYIFNKRTGLSPLAPGQWKGFLAVYSGFYIFNNIIRPVRLAASVAVSPYFEKLVLKVQEKLRLKKKATAVTLTVLIVNLIGTTGLMFGLVSVAASLSGVPVFVPKP
mmetsp:Transcript_19866/g.25587  ORF Transcript_19866/g.25587 Transcript_19866/m.25587 type:complete len:291 (-) Transcript_19866:284-1156(-)|eukprot:CAMPEP_0198151012 /NCGR_PEP_ID=MMETSP1443-20131203/53738_1 /TAXON_ID=186043 /ORGANISM="Entomoneis sp., Strain CCMP2396" /LENGTH=290 /DNA_ID=CAMNT_0043816531 /DNA_START=47 /DNA_END=919 /DNA_ORIENTATION=+